jgi:prepilin-type N-terminal cleavage/methylation domain-containing protein
MNKKAVTIAEILVVLAIISILSGSAYLLLSKGKYTIDFLDTRATLTANARTEMQEIIRDLSDSSANTITKDISGSIPYFTDPLNNENHQVLVFASARGNPNEGPEDSGYDNNNYVHLGADYKPSWRSVIVYCTYVTSEGMQQLSKYVDYGSSTTYYASASNIFPFSVVSITASSINLIRGDGTSLNIPRDSGIPKANYIASEDMNNNGVLDSNENDSNNTMPADNKNNVLDRGADFNLTGGLLKIRLFLAKPETSLTRGTRFLTVTLDGASKLRNR